MRKRIVAAALCAALLLVLSLGQPYTASGETYDLYFREADLNNAPGADALRDRAGDAGGRGDPGHQDPGGAAGDGAAGRPGGPCPGGDRPGRHRSAVPGTGRRPRGGGPVLPIPAALRRGADPGGLRHHSDADPAAGDLHRQHHRPGPAPGLPGPADLRRRRRALLQQRGRDRRPDGHAVPAG